MIVIHLIMGLALLWRVCTSFVSWVIYRAAERWNNFSKIICLFHFHFKYLDINIGANKVTDLTLRFKVKKKKTEKISSM